MDTLGYLGQGFGVALTPYNLVTALSGTLIGTIVGLLPGLGPINGVLVRPRIQVMEKDLALAAKLVEPIVGRLDVFGEDGEIDTTWDDPMRPMPEDPMEADDAEADADDLAPMITPKKIGVPLVLSISAGLLTFATCALEARRWR